MCATPLNFAHDSMSRLEMPADLLGVNHTATDINDVDTYQLP
jgi:hypothetical protein